MAETTAGPATAATRALFEVDTEYLEKFTTPPLVSNTYEFDYNPKDLTISGGATWKPDDGNQAHTLPVMQFVNPNPRQVKLKLFLDHYGRDDGDVSTQTAILFDWTRPRTSKSEDEVSAPYLRFQWGNRKDFKCFIKSISVTYTMFSVDGTPLRANVDLSLEETFDSPGFTNPTSGGEGGERRHVVALGDTLHSVAEQLYGHPRFWRGLAAFNGVDDPLRLAPGTRLAAPPADDIASLS